MEGLGVAFAAVAPQLVLAACWAPSGIISTAAVAWVVPALPLLVPLPPLVPMPLLVPVLLPPGSLGVGVPDGVSVGVGVGVGVACVVSVGVAVGVGVAVALATGLLGLGDGFGEQATAGSSMVPPLGCWAVPAAAAGVGITPSGAHGCRPAASALPPAGPAEPALCALTEFVGVIRVGRERFSASAAPITMITTAETAATGRSHAAAGPRRRRAPCEGAARRRLGWPAGGCPRLRKGPDSRPGLVKSCRTCPRAVRPVSVAGSSRTKNRIPLSRSHSVSPAASDPIDRGEFSR